MEQYKFALVVGDHSHDGHNQVEKFIVISNKPMKDVQEAYRKGVVRCGVDLTRFVAAEYDDPYIYAEEVNLFKRNDDKFVIENFGDEDSDKKYFLIPKEFCLLWIYIAKQGDQDLVIEEDKDRLENCVIGGYGLFT